MLLVSQSQMLCFLSGLKMNFLGKLRHLPLRSHSNAWLSLEHFHQCASQPTVNVFITKTTSPYVSNVRSFSLSAPSFQKHQESSDALSSSVVQPLTQLSEEETLMKETGLIFLSLQIFSYLFYCFIGELLAIRKLRVIFS